MKEITLKTPTSESKVYCGANAFKSYISEYKNKQIFLVTDTNVYAIYSKLIDDSFGSNCPKCVFEAGEQSKNPQTLFRILNLMLSSGMRRNCTVIAFGGGVVGDIAGLAAALYMRGVHLVQVPTTILAQVDSSVGGKTAVDMCGVKNVIGTFYQPERVIADPMFFATLPEREVKCGLGEIIKYGALDGNLYLKLIENVEGLNCESFLSEIVFDCIRHKAQVVESDERDENGARKTLNLGHTTGHALELFYGNKSHGEYVLIGMYCELQLARNCGICGGQYAKNIEMLVLKVLEQLPQFKDIQSAANVALHDKKNDDDNIVLIVPEREGKCAELKLPLLEYKKFLKDCFDNAR